VRVSPSLEAAVAWQLACEIRGCSQVSGCIRIAREPTELLFCVTVPPLPPQYCCTLMGIGGGGDEILEGNTLLLREEVTGSLIRNN
jgi:hypothetical protein